MQDPYARARRKRQNNHPLCPQAGLSYQYHSHHWVQCRGAGLQKYKVPGLGCRGTGKTKEPVEPLFRKMQGFNICGGQLRPGANRLSGQRTEQDNEPRANAGISAAGPGQQEGHGHNERAVSDIEAGAESAEEKLGDFPSLRHQGRRTQP